MPPRPARPGLSVRLVLQPARAEPRALLVLLHGLGAAEDDLLGLAPALPTHLSYAAVRAPLPYAWGGYAWYHLAAPEQEATEVPTSLAALRACIETLPGRTGIGLEHTAILGFSQGAVMAAGLLADPDAPALAGYVLLSGYSHPALRPPPTADLSQRAVFVGHGTDDPVIPPEGGRQLACLLQERGATVAWRAYPMAHAIDDAELTDVHAWLTEILS